MVGTCQTGKNKLQKSGLLRQKSNYIFHGLRWAVGLERAAVEMRRKARKRSVMRGTRMAQDMVMTTAAAGLTMGILKKM